MGCMEMVSPLTVVLVALLAIVISACVTFAVVRRRSGAAEGSQAGSGWQPGRELVDGHRPPDWEALSSQLLGFTRQVTAAEGAVMLMPEEAGWRVCLASPGLKVSPRVGKREGLLALAFEGEKEITAESVHPEALGYLSGRSGNVSIALMPALHRGRIRGILACHKAAGRPFEDREMGVLRRCSKILDGWETYAAHAIAVEKQRDQDERLARGLELLASERRPDEICGLALDAIFDILPALYGFAVIQAPRFDYAYLGTKRFNSPDNLRYLDKQTWAYWVMTKGREPLYLEGATSRETAMPILFKGEPFAPGNLAYLHPVFSGDDVLGVVGLIGREDLPFTQESRKAASRFVSQVSALVTLSLFDRQTQENAIKDGLTGLYNRRFFDERFVEELSRSQRGGMPVAILLMDIDHFKRVNDTYGHPVGDLVLKEVSRGIRTSLRDIDVICRYGGEEFVAILPGCSIKEAAVAGERVRTTVEAMQRNGVTLPAPVTISIGVASFPHPFSTPSGLIKGADEALYGAKQKGRNRVVTAR